MRCAYSAFGVTLFILIPGGVAPNVETDEFGMYMQTLPTFPVRRYECKLPLGSVHPTYFIVPEARIWTPHDRH